MLMFAARKRDAILDSRIAKRIAKKDAQQAPPKQSTSPHKLSAEQWQLKLALPDINDDLEELKRHCGGDPVRYLNQLAYDSVQELNMDASRRGVLAERESGIVGAWSASIEQKWGYLYTQLGCSPEWERADRGRKCAASVSNGIDYIIGEALEGDSLERFVENGGFNVSWGGNLFVFSV